jgi:hypothetical protein
VLGLAVAVSVLPLAPVPAVAVGQVPGIVECLPSPLDFGGVVLGTGSVDATLTCTNTGRVRVTIVGVDVSGSHAADFTADGTPCIRTLSPTASCQLQVTFAPGAAGARQATLTLRTSPQTPAQPITVPLRGNGIARDSTLQLDPPALVFAEQLGFTTSPEQVITARNAGTVPVTISVVAVEDDPLGEFAVAATGCRGTTLPPGSSCMVSVTFTPRASGGRAGAAVRLDSDGTGSPHRIPLSGAGTVPAILVDPAVGPAGAVVSAFGAGFPPAQPVTLQWVDAVTLLPVGFPEPTVLPSPGADGTFVATVLLFPHTATGGRTLHAANGFFAADASFLVVPSTAKAPDFVTRG